MDNAGIVLCDRVCAVSCLFFAGFVFHRPSGGQASFFSGDGCIIWQRCDEYDGNGYPHDDNFYFLHFLVVLSTYSSQFSPRAPENLVHSQTPRRVLGIFLGGFVYTSLSLLYMQEKTFSHDVITPTLGILVTFYCVGTFAYFIHYVSRNIQVSSLIDKLTGDTRDVINKYKKLQDECLQDSGELRQTGGKNVIGSPKEGYIQFIDMVGLVKFAEEQDCEMEIVARTGDYIQEKDAVLHIYEHQLKDFSVEKFFTVGHERTVGQDIGYGFQKLMEVAVRAISPSLNDPNTANEILLRIGSLFGEIGYLNTSQWILSDSQGRSRVSYNFPTYSDLLYEVYYQLAFYGKDDISVLLSMTKSLKIAAKNTPADRHGDIWEIQQYILDNLDFAHMKKLDVKFLHREVSELAELTGHQGDDLQLSHS